MAAMQALGPEMKKLQAKYKGAENRAQMNEEMMKLYKEHNVNPASGCLPMLLQMPAFFVLYSVIRGITNTVTIPAHTMTVAGFKKIVPEPGQGDPPLHPESDRRCARTSLLLTGNSIRSEWTSPKSCSPTTARSSSPSPTCCWWLRAVGLQYLQMSRLNARNPQASQANPQAAMLQKYMPLIFGFIYLNVAAILNVYFIISSAIRILTQEILFRKGIVAGPPTRSCLAGGRGSQEGAGRGPDRTGPPQGEVDGWRGTGTAKGGAGANGSERQGPAAEPGKAQACQDGRQATAETGIGSERIERQEAAPAPEGQPGAGRGPVEAEEHKNSPTGATDPRARIGGGGL